MSRWLTQDEQVAWRGLLGMTSRLNARMNRQLQDDFGMSLADYDVLVVLSEAPRRRLRVYEITEALAWEQSRVSHQIGRMQRRGLVRREDCPTDARGAFVVLTDVGRAAIERAAPAHVDTVRSLVFDGLSPDEIAALTAVTSRVLDRLRDLGFPCLAAGMLGGAKVLCRRGDMTPGARRGLRPYPHAGVPERPLAPRGVRRGTYDVEPSR